ncbi:hypothetical protein [Brooklawnia cerclae]|uniref:Uncharacterized protein n=2 Tax=Brooklawnia cerclae TaxID=349934 RepID=A0ABX0SI59_9ACTN|nr:hypothetical protein [Brooklawnia cerclae]NIH58085.1 hypothetical protein [Brooklawnia cerclae]
MEETVAIVRRLLGALASTGWPDVARRGDLFDRAGARETSTDAGAEPSHGLLDVGGQRWRWSSADGTVSELGLTLSATGPDPDALLAEVASDLRGALASELGQQGYVVGDLTVWDAQAGTVTVSIDPDEYDIGVTIASTGD